MTATVDNRVVIDLDRCIECGSCSAACSSSHGGMPIVNFARSGAALLPVICRQCKTAACVDACPADAMVRDDRGVVRRRLFRCIGCGSCVRGCPFGAIDNELGGVPAGFASPEQINGHQAAKCDLCADRVGDGAEPRCVATCPAAALSFVDEREADRLGLVVLGGRTTGNHPFNRR